MTTKIKEMSLEELKTFINEAVDMRLKERFGDPDVGLTIKPEIIQTIRRSRRSKVTIPAEKVAKSPGLKW